MLFLCLVEAITGYHMNQGYHPSDYSAKSLIGSSMWGKGKGSGPEAHLNIPPGGKVVGFGNNLLASFLDYMHLCATDSPLCYAFLGITRARIWMGVNSFLWVFHDFIYTCTPPSFPS